jgi:hypothetical protein
MKATINRSAERVIITKQRTTAAVGVGGAKSLALGARDRRGQFCARIREIR